MLKFKRSKKGFTLVELMVVVVIIGILTAIAIPVYSSVTQNAKIKTSLANQRSIDSAIQAYYSNNNAWPSEIEDLIPNYIAELPSDPFNGVYSIGKIANNVEKDPTTGAIISAEYSYVCKISKGTGPNAEDIPDAAILHPDAE